MNALGVEEIIVFRYGHRDVRDYRVTSHCALVSRALGADKIIICGNKDDKVEKTIAGVNTRWGGPFKIEFVKTWQEPLERLKKEGFILVHLTMYGEQIHKINKKISKNKKICIIIGSQKVEKEIYKISNYNVSVTNQPHSEIAALAICLDKIQNSKELEKHFSNAQRQIIPEKKGKKVIALK